MRRFYFSPSSCQAQHLLKHITRSLMWGFAFLSYFGHDRKENLSEHLASIRSSTWQFHCRVFTFEMLYPRDSRFQRWRASFQGILRWNLLLERAFDGSSGSSEDRFRPNLEKSILERIFCMQLEGECHWVVTYIYQACNGVMILPIWVWIGDHEARDWPRDN